MNVLRAIAFATSLAAHVSFAAYVVAPWTSESANIAFDQGTGDDQFVVEQGVGIDGIVKLGDSVETIRAAEVTPVEATPPPPTEVKPIDDLQDTIVSNSATAVEDNIVKVPDPPPEVQPEDVKPPDVPTVVAVPPVAVAESRDASSGAAKTGGDASALAEYRGKLAKLFQECKFPPKHRVSGKAQVRIVVDEQGKIVGREIAKSSGSAEVDQAALANVDYAIKDCREQALPQAPEGLSETDRTVLQGYIFK